MKNKVVGIEEAILASPSSTKKTKLQHPVVAIGTTVNQQQVLLSLVTHLPADLGITYVIVQHPFIEADTALLQLLEQNAAMPVRRIADQRTIKPNYIYLAPEDAAVSIGNGKYILHPTDENEVCCPPIDFFLMKLAEAHNGFLAAILLGDAIANSQEGVQYLKAAGGFTFALPANNVAANTHAGNSPATATDFELVQDTIAEQLTQLVANFNKLLVNEDCELNETELKSVATLLYKQKEVNVLLYGNELVSHRIHRRMQVTASATVADYLQKLTTHTAEADELYEEIIAYKTYFFKNTAIYTTLTKTVFPTLLKNRDPQYPVRIWCPACGTGEEAVSLAISLLEYMRVKRTELPIQVFGTDINTEAIKQARSGLYSPSALQQVTPPQLKRYFVKIGSHYKVVSAVRDVCIFASHNVLKDPPFPRLDIISFHDSPVELFADTHHKIQQSFHFGLQPAGFLLLGNKGLPGDTTYFTPLDNTENIYTRNLSGYSYKAGANTPAAWQLLPPLSTPTLPRDTEAAAQPDALPVDIAAEKILLSKYVPASLVIDGRYRIIRFHGPVHKYLRPVSGKASLDVLSMLKEELAFELQLLVQLTSKDKKITRRRNVQVVFDDKETTVTIETTSLQPSGSAFYYLVVFTEQNEPALWDDADETQGLQALEEELQQVQEQLVATTEEYKRSREEWQVVQEKMTASAEEMLSTNQALEINNQELQAAVKELMVVNEDLDAQNMTLLESSDLSINILEAIRDPLILLNTNLSVQTANKAFYSTFKLTPAGTEGRFLYQIGNNQWNVPEILTRLSEVVSKKNGFTSFEVPLADNKVQLFNAVHIDTGNKRSDRILITMQDITQYRQAREAKEWLAAVVGSSNEGIISFTSNRTIISWNKGAEEIFGYTETEMVGKSLSRLVRQTDKPTQQKLVERVMKGEVVRQLEMEYLHKDGYLIHISISIALIKDVKGNIKGLMASVQDVTERKKAVEALQESEERFRPIVSESSVGIARADFNGKLLFINNKLSEMLGYTVEEIVGKTIWDFAYPYQLERTRQMLKTLQQEGTPFKYEWQLLRKNNIPLWVNINLSAIKDTKGVPFSLTAVILDISKTKAAEEELQKAKESLQLVLEAANMGSWEMDLTSEKTIYHSLRNDQVMGYGVLQPNWSLSVASKNVLDEDKHLFDEAIERMMNHGRLNMEVRVRWPDGSIHWVYKLGQVFYDANGKHQRAAGISMDVTDRKLAEQRKESFLGIASHELKTPVTSIKAYAQILQQRLIEAEDYNSASLLSKLDKQVDKLTNLIKDLLDTTALVKGQLALRQEPIDLNGLIKEVAEDIRIGSATHKLVKKLHPLPFLRADRERLRQVIINLITNAIKYSPNADKVIICSESDGEKATIHIQDYGIGIPEEAQQRVFERFYRAGAAATAPGLGLGLFISSEIIRQHGGNIWVTSKQGEGSVFSFSLPVAGTTL